MCAAPRTVFTDCFETLNLLLSGSEDVHALWILFSDGILLRSALCTLSFLTYEGCSNMNASNFITFFTYMLRYNAISFWKELYLRNLLTHTVNNLL